MLRILVISIIFQLLNPDLAWSCSTKTASASAESNINNSSQTFADTNPKTSDELRQAIENSQPGDVIELLPIVYEGNFQLVGSKDVTIKGTNKENVSTTIISTGSAFDILGNNWTIKNLKIQGTLIGVNINGTKNTVSGIAVAGVRKGVVIAGDENIVRSSSIKSDEIGFNIIGNRNQMKSSSISKSTSSSGIHMVGNQNVFSSIAISCGENRIIARDRVNRDTNMANARTRNETEIANVNGIERESFKSTTLPTCSSVNGNETESFNSTQSTGINMNRHERGTLISTRSTGVNIYGNENSFSASSVRCVVDGVIIDGDNNVVKSSSIQSQEMGINVLKGNGNKIETSSITKTLNISNGTSNGSVYANSFKGQINIFGNGYTITSNSGTGGANIQGCDNRLSQNSIRNAVISECNEIDNSNYFG